MSVNKLHIQNFLEMAHSHPVLDVRSPGEFHHAHIPGALSLPLFSNEERKVVGTFYKQRSRQDAIKIGLDYFGPKMRLVVEQVEAILQEQNQRSKTESKTVLLHCWRGGMRSGAVAWLLDLYGFEVHLLTGGYKAFRKWVLESFEKDYELKILGGYTGSGKTDVLQELKRKKEAVIDLEAIAAHKGSAFGAMGEPEQPRQEMFENKLAVELFAVTKLKQPIWVEDESQRIGLINIPKPLWLQMRRSPLYFLEIDFDHRLAHIVAGYGKFEKDQLVNAIIRIQKRLGPLETKTAINHLLEDDVTSCFSILLRYYDKQYSKGLNAREGLKEQLHNIPCDRIHAKEITQKLIELKQTV